MSKETTRREFNRRRFLVASALAPLIPLRGLSARTEPQKPEAGKDTRAGGEAQFSKLPGYKLDAHLKTRKLAILPLGSVEYHGPSGPAATDSLIATGLAERLAPGLGASLLPTVEYTHCPAHTAAFRGTISIRPEVITAYLTDILGSLVEHGFNRIFVLNGHDGNIGAARLAISQVTHQHTDVAILFVSWWETLPGPLVDRLEIFDQPNGGHGHGGPLEMSVAAAFAPESVEAGKGPDLSAIEGFTQDFPYYLEKDHAEGWPGYSGKLSEIAREKGDRLVEISSQRLEKLVRTWLANPKARGSW